MNKISGPCIGLGKKVHGTKKKFLEVTFSPRDLTTWNLGALKCIFLDVNMAIFHFKNH